MKPGDILKGRVESLSYHGGRGVMRVDGWVVFVEGAAPGDLVEVRVTVVKSNLLEAQIQNILEAGDSRRDAPCQVADKCGGCSWQHIQYDEQLRQKQKILQDNLRRLSRNHEFKMLAFIPAPSEFAYRNRIQVQVRGQNVGFFESRSNRLVPTRHCLIAEPKVNLSLKELNLAGLNGQRVEIAMTQSGEVEVFSTSREPTELRFAQVNTAQNEELKKHLLEAVGSGMDWIVELYAGAGNFTFALSHRLSSTPIFAVERSRSSVDLATSLNQNKLIKFICADAARGLRNLPRFSGKGLLVLDPPRPGCDQSTIDEIVNLQPSEVVYISCNPTTFARDCERLFESGGYQLEWVRGLDMFPQTEHVELIAKLALMT